MKKGILILGVLLPMICSYAQQNTGINTTTPDPSAALEVQATDQGFLLPRVALQTPTDGTTIPSPATGLTVYNTNAVGMVEGFYSNYGTPAAPQWVHLGPEIGTPIMVFTGKLSQDFTIGYNATGGGGGVNTNTRVQGSMVNVMVNNLNAWNPATGVFSPKIDGTYRIEIAFDYNYSPNGSELISPGTIRPSMLYGLYNITDGNWIYRKYEYLLANRTIANTSGVAAFSVGYIEMEVGKDYAFYFVPQIDDSDYNAGERVVIKEQSAGTTGNADSTFFILQKVRGL